MRIKPLLCYLFLLPGLMASAQTGTPKPATASKSTANQEVKIRHDEIRNVYFIADKKTGKAIKVLPYAEVQPFEDGLAMVSTGKSIGYINTKGAEVVPPNGKYAWGYNFKEGMAVVGTYDEWGNKKAAGYINKTGTLIVPLKYQDARSFSEGLAAVKKSGKWGYINKTGTMIIPAVYADAFSFHCSMAAVAKHQVIEGDSVIRYGYITKAGKTAISFIYDDAGAFRETGPEYYSAIVSRDFQQYIIDKKGGENSSLSGLEEDVSLLNMEWASETSWHLIVETRKKYQNTTFGVYDYFAACFLIKPEYDRIEVREDPYYESKYYLLNGHYKFQYLSEGFGLVKTSISKLDAIYDYIDFIDTMVYAIQDAIVEDGQIAGGIFSLYDLNLSPITERTYDFITHFSHGLARVYLGDSVGFINKQGEEVIPLIYEDAGEYGPDGVAVLLNGKVGVVDGSGKVIIPFMYDNIGKLDNGFAFYQRDSLFGVIAADGTEVTAPIYKRMGNFSEGLAQVILDEKVGFVNTKGDLVVPCMYDFAYEFSEGMSLVLLNDSVGYINTKGELVIPCQYQDGTDFVDGVALVLKDDTKYLIEKKGIIIKTY